MSASVIIQARTSSTRLPGKVLAPLGEQPLISFLIERVKQCDLPNHILLATTTSKSDDLLASIAAKCGVDVVRGSENDVLSRFALAAQKTTSNIFVRITADCPLVDPVLLSQIVNQFIAQDFDYLSNNFPPSYPDGLDLEVFSRKALLLANEKCNSPPQREHVTPWMRESGELRVGCVSHSSDLSSMRWTVDEPEDLELIRSIVDNFDGRSDFSWLDVLKLSKKNPQLFNMNSHISRNEGSHLGTGQKLWRRAKRVIPGGNMLLSKRAEMFLPEQWPAYFSKSKGCHVWDLDDNCFVDMSIMGIGTNILGYGNEEVDSAVVDAVNAGNMSTFNCPEEVLLAERLVDIHPWSDMVRFARSGGEANSIAIRIARAATGRDTVAICGYHGWHDWYLACNLVDRSNLEQHLLPGLNPKGVPSTLSGTVQPFTFNKFDELEQLALNHNLAAVKMEVQRSIPPDDGFLQNVRDLCTRRGIVLIFDECTSGFRETFGGLHLKYNVLPDMAMFGKALGNGYAVTSVIGRKAVMESAQSTFISSTFWTERIGSVAALKTLEVMEKQKSWEIVSSKGRTIKERWRMLSEKHHIGLNISGLDSLATFSFIQNNLLCKTLMTQEMLRKGYLATNACYVCTAHESTTINSYFDALDEVFDLISSCNNDPILIESLLKGPVCHSGFKRLN